MGLEIPIGKLPSEKGSVQKAKGTPFGLGKVGFSGDTTDIRPRWI
jgi:hypothetical protein